MADCCLVIKLLRLRRIEKDNACRVSSSARIPKGDRETRSRGTTRISKHHQPRTSPVTDFIGSTLQTAYSGYDQVREANKRHVALVSAYEIDGLTCHCLTGRDVALLETRTPVRTAAHAEVGFVYLVSSSPASAYFAHSECRPAHRGPTRPANFCFFKAAAHGKLSASLPFSREVMSRYANGFRSLGVIALLTQALLSSSHAAR